MGLKKIQRRWEGTARGKRIIDIDTA